MRYSEFKLVESLIGKDILAEGARIQHAEDIVFWEGSKGAVRALESLIKLERGGHENVTVKWDGSPAIIFGRDNNGSFILTDKSLYLCNSYILIKSGGGFSRFASKIVEMRGNVVINPFDFKI